MKKSSRSSVNKLLVDGSSVNRLLVKTSTSWSLSVVGRSLVSRSLAIRPSVRILGKESLVNRTSVEDDISELMKDFELVDFTLQSLQTLSIADPIDLVTEIQSLIDYLPITNPILANNYIEADHSVKTNVMPSDAEIINAILNYNCNEDDEIESK
ncbi:6054_t:CDS:2, partial [Cetraspora pellucida]